MMISHSRQSFRHNRGFTVIEMLLGLVISGITVTMMVWLVGMFFGSRNAIQSTVASQRQSVDEIAIVLTRAGHGSHQAFLFNGILSKADGTAFLGGSLELSKPASEIEDNSDFLGASSLTFTSGTTRTVVINTPHVSVLTLNSETLSNGWTSVTVTFCDELGVRRSKLQFPPSASALQLQHAKGAVSTLGDGNIEVILPNPLSHPAMSLPETHPGARVVLPHKVGRRRA